MYSDCPFCDWYDPYFGCLYPGYCPSQDDEDEDEDLW